LSNLQLAKLYLGTQPSPPVGRFGWQSPEPGFNNFMNFRHFMNLLKASSVKNRPYSFNQNDEIQPERPIIYISQIHFHPLFELDAVTFGFDLPET